MGIYRYYPTERIYELREMLERSVRIYSGKTAFLQGISGKYRAVSYGELSRDIQRLGGAFIRRGLRGKKVIFVGKGSYEWCVAYLAVSGGLGTAVTVSSDISAAELTAVVKKISAAALVFSEDQRQKVTAAGKRLQKYSFRDIDSICNDNGSCTAEDIDAYNGLSMDIDGVAHIAFGADSNAEKGVMLSQRNMRFSVEMSGRLVRILSSDTVLSLQPLDCITELVDSLLLPLSKGATVAFADPCRDDGASLNNIMREVHPTAISCTPKMLSDIYSEIYRTLFRKNLTRKVNYITSFTDKLPSEIARKSAKRRAFAGVHSSLGGRLRLIVCNGESLSAEPVAERMKALGFNVVRGLGMNEACGRLTLSPDTASKDGAVGIPLCGSEIKIASPNIHGVGEICCRGDNIMLGYYKEAEMTAAVKKNGWLHTGIRGFADGDGFVTVTRS